jgi:solute carrier family 25 protein 38
MKERLDAWESTVDQPPIVKNLISSSCAALVATVVTQPADIIRTQAQLSFTDANAFRVVFQRCRELGFKTLFIGSTPRFIKRPLQAILVWTVYEELFRIAAEQKERLVPKKQ